jgi:cysteine desulfurase
LQTLEGIYLNGHPHQRLAGNLNISLEGINGSALLLAMQPIAAISSGSACSSAQTAPSHVLTALGRHPALAYASFRFGMGRSNRREDIERVADQFITQVRSLRSSPLLTYS